MATKTYTANRSSLFASSNLGGGNDQHLPSGQWGSYGFKSVCDFPAIDWSDVVKLTSATLRLRTTGQVHVGFGSSPDVIVRRAASQWTPNSSSSSADGGSGWGTSPTAYPGPATTGPYITKRCTTVENTAVSIDVTDVVLGWAPPSVEGGLGAGQYGLMLYPAVSGSTGDTIEFYSAKHGTTSYRPALDLVYETDRPPTAPGVGNLTSPVLTLKPELTATAVDPDQDPAEVYDVAVLEGSTVRYERLAQTAGIAADGIAIAHEVQANLPALVPLTARFRTRHLGIWSPYASSASFTIDRLPDTPTWSSPAANVGAGILRPTFTFHGGDPDGEAITHWSLEVFNDGGNGVPDGAAVYVRTNNDAPSFGWTPAGKTITHTANTDLPTGALIARARLQIGIAAEVGAWSAYRAFVISGDKAAISIQAPTADGSYLDVPTMADPGSSITTGQQIRIAFTVTAPAAGAVATVRVKIQVAGGGAVLTDTQVGTTAKVYDLLYALPDGTTYNNKLLELTITTTTTLAATNVRMRPCRLAYARFAMNGIQVGPSSRNFTSAYTNAPGSSSKVYVTYRAQTTPTSGSLPPGYVPDIDDAAAAIPPAGGYLGIMVRVVRLDLEDAVLSGVDTLSVSWESLG